MFVWTRDTGAARKSQITALALTALFFGLSFFTSVNLWPQRANVYEHAKSSTMLVSTPTSWGSGVVVERNSTSGRRVFLWTAAHVVIDSPTTVKTKIIFRDAEGCKAGEGTFDADLLGISPELDLALYWVHVPDSMVTDVKFAEDGPQPIGSEIFHVGNFLGPRFDNSLTRGIVSQHNLDPHEPGWFWPVADQADLAVIPGGSGGGVFRNSDGAVIGLMVAGLGQTSVTAYVPNRTIHAWAVQNGLGFAFSGSICPTDSVLNQAVAVAKAEHEIIRLFVLPP
jgi:S1-C subfamily serine protease